jgi:hypothetical protein
LTRLNKGGQKKTRRRKKEKRIWEQNKKGKEQMSKMKEPKQNKNKG